MLIRISFPFLLVILFLVSCQKDLTTSPVASIGESAKPAALTSLATVDSSDGWYGLYVYPLPFPGGDPDWTGDTIVAYDLIKNGFASIANYPDLGDVKASSIEYQIPSSHTVSGDSIVFEATVRSDADYVNMRIWDAGKFHGAYLYIDTPVNGKRSFYIEVGSAYKEVLVKSVSSFTSYHLIQFALRGTTAFLYVDNKLICKLPFSNSDRIGNVSLLSMYTPGIIECDQSRLLNSYTRKVRMKEDFNIDGQTHTTWY